MGGSTDVGDVKKILDNTGSIIPINNKIKLIREIEKLILNKKILYKNFKAKRRIMKYYQIQKIANNFDERIS